MTNDIPKKTKGELKMERYIDDLIRNKEFLSKIKRLRRNNKNPDGMYDTWTNEEKANHEYINKELTEIIDAYNKLRKRTNKLMIDDYWKTRQGISQKYNLDSEQINYIECLFNSKRKDILSFMKFLAEFEMCKVSDLHQDELSPLNKGEEIIYLNKRRQLLLNAYPVGILINPRASKNDVLDFIENRWNWIEMSYLRTYAEKKLKYGKRKHNQKILDFIWSNRFLPSKKLKEKLDEQFPKNGLVYYEINKILQGEKNKRLGNSS